jgi:hypothetical protein
MRPRKATAPQPPQERSFTEPPPYASKGRGRPGYSESPAGRQGYPLGATLSLIEELQEHGKTTVTDLSKNMSKCYQKIDRILTKLSKLSEFWHLSVKKG